MELVLDFGAVAPRIKVSLSEGTDALEVLTRLQEAVAEGKRHVVHLISQSAALRRVPRHGIIDFNRLDEPLPVEAEGPWWLYVRPMRVQATSIVLRIVGDVANVVLAIEPRTNS